MISKAKAINANAKIGLFTPSDPIVNHRIEKLRNGIEILRNWGFRVDEPTSEQWEAWSKQRTPKERTDEIHSLLFDSSIEILLATWGGKNCNDLLDLLDYKLFRIKRKPILGVSDVATLLNAISYKSRLVTFYGPNIAGKLDETDEKGLSKLMSDSTNIVTQSLLPNKVTYHIIRSGGCEGQLVGGSLGTYTVGLSGTPYYPNFRKVILFWESSSLDLSQIRQHIQHLRLANAAENIQGVIIGATNKVTENISELDRTLLELFPEDNIPIIRGDFLGHGVYPNPILPIAAKVKLTTDPISLILLDGIVE